MGAPSSSATRLIPCGLRLVKGSTQPWVSQRLSRLLPSLRAIANCFMSSCYLQPPEESIGSQTKAFSCRPLEGVRRRTLLVLNSAAVPYDSRHRVKIIPAKVFARPSSAKTNAGAILHRKHSTRWPVAAIQVFPLAFFFALVLRGVRKVERIPHFP